MKSVMFLVILGLVYASAAPVQDNHVDYKRFFLQDVKDALQSAADFLTQTYNSAKEQALKLASGLDFKAAVDALVPDLTAGETVNSCVATCDKYATQILGQYSQSAHELCIPVCEGALAKVNELAHGKTINKRFFLQDVKDALQSAGDFLTQTYNSAKEQVKKLASGLDFTAAVDALVPDLTAGETIDQCVKTCDGAATQVLGHYSQSAHELCQPVCEGALAKVNELAHGKNITKRFFLQDVKDALQSAGDFLTQTYNSAKEQVKKLASGLDFTAAVDALVPDLTAGETIDQCVKTCDGAATQVLGHYSQSAHELCQPVCEGALAKVNELAHGKNITKRFMLDLDKIKEVSQDIIDHMTHGDKDALQGDLDKLNEMTHHKDSKRFLLKDIQNAIDTISHAVSDGYNKAKEAAQNLVSGLDFSGAVDALVPDLTAGESVDSCIATCDGAAASVLGQFSSSAHELCKPVCEGALDKLNEAAHGKSKRFLLDNINDALNAIGDGLQAAGDFFSKTYNTAKDAALKLVSGLDFTAAVDALLPDLTAGETVSSCVATCDGAALSVLGEYSQSAHELCLPVCEGALAKMNEAAHGSR